MTCKTNAKVTKVLAKEVKSYHSTNRFGSVLVIIRLVNVRKFVGNVPATAEAKSLEASNKIQRIKLFKVW